MDLNIAWTAPNPGAIPIVRAILAVVVAAEPVVVRVAAPVPMVIPAVIVLVPVVAVVAVAAGISLCLKLFMVASAIFKIV